MECLWKSHSLRTADLDNYNWIQGLYTLSSYSVSVFNNVVPQTNAQLSCDTTPSTHGLKDNTDVRKRQEECVGLSLEMVYNISAHIVLVRRQSYRLRHAIKENGEDVLWKMKQIWWAYNTFCVSNLNSLFFSLPLCSMEIILSIFPWVIVLNEWNWTKSPPPSFLIKFHYIDQAWTHDPPL